MYIYKIIIQNFRNFENFSWKPNKTLNILFGHNGCGKTNLAEAISLVFSTNRFSSFFETEDYYNSNISKNIKIQAWIKNFDNIATDMSSKIQHLDKDDNFIMGDSEDITQEVLIYQLESIEDQKMEWSFFQQTGTSISKVSDRNAVGFHFIDANRNPLKEVGFQEKSILYKLYSDIIGDELDRISDEIITKANSEICVSKTIQKYLEDMKSLSNKDFIENYKLLLKDPRSTWNTSGYELGTMTGDAILRFDRQSKGIQNLFLLLLMKKQLGGSGIVFIEELEQNLEPKNQRYIADEYKSLDTGQLFITSHSPEIISHFNYENVYIIDPTMARNIYSGLDSKQQKLIYRTNKKDFISALMAPAVLFVEGDSEFESFHVYNSLDHDLNKLDIEIVNIGGKDNAETYCKVFNHFEKIIYLLIDNDDDITSTINKTKDYATKILISNNCYEDLIYKEVKKIKDAILNDILDFSFIKSKLTSIINCSDDKTGIKKYIEQNGINIGNIATYSDILEHKEITVYVLHDSYASSFYAHALAEEIMSVGKPTFFSNLITLISASEIISVPIAPYTNVYNVTNE